MLVRAILACSAILLLTPHAAADECLNLEFKAREALVCQAPTCDKAIELFGNCAFGGGGDILGISRPRSARRVSCKN
jgi:hypothetical protein